MRNPRFRRGIMRLAMTAGRFQNALHRRATTGWLVFAFATALLATGLALLSIDNRTSSWIAESDSDGALVGTEPDFVLLVRRGVDIDAESVEFVAADLELARTLGEIDGVSAVESVSRVLGQLNRASLKELGDAIEFFDNSLLFSDRTIAVQRIWLDPGIQSTPIIDEIERVVHPELGKFSVLGPAAFNAALDRRSRGESVRVFSLALAIAGAVLALILRSLILALVLLANSLFGVIWFLGIAGWCGVSFNFLTINVPVLAFVIALALGIHPLCAWRRLMRRHRIEGADVFRAVALRTFPGCFFAAATTTAGFASLGLSRVGAVREFGLLAALSIPVVFTAGFICLPLALRWCERRDRLPSSWPSSWPSMVPWLLIQIRRYRQPIRFGTPVLFATACFLLPTLSIDHKALDFFADDDPYREEYLRAEGEIVGLAPLEVDVTLPGSVADPGNMRLLERAVHSMEEAAGMTRSYSILEFVKFAASLQKGGAPGSYTLPDSDSMLKFAYSMTSFSRDATKYFVSRGGRNCRVVLPLNVTGADEFRRICDGVSRSSDLLPGVKTKPGGLIYRLMLMQEKTLDEQIVTLGAAMAGVSILVGLFLGSARLSFLALLVNFLPLAITGSAMALLGISLDLTSAMVASVAIGIAVDDTIHLLWECQRVPDASLLRLDLVLERVAPPIAITSIVLMTGFAALGAASFPPIARLGCLTAATLALSLFVHLVILPAYLEPGRQPPRQSDDGRDPVRARGPATTVANEDESDLSYGRARMPGPRKLLGIVLLLAWGATSCRVQGPERIADGGDESPASSVKEHHIPSDRGVSSIRVEIGATVFDDQYGKKWRGAGLMKGPVVLVLGTPNSVDQNKKWDNDVVRPSVDGTIIAEHRALDLRGYPQFAGGLIASKIRVGTNPPGTPVLLDWEGALARCFEVSADLTTVLLLDADGLIRFRSSGEPDSESAMRFREAVDCIVRNIEQAQPKSNGGER